MAEVTYHFALPLVVAVTASRQANQQDASNPDTAVTRFAYTI
jgi:hypothetical protein